MLSIIMLGLNHQSAPLAVRERLSWHGCALDRTLEDLSRSAGLTASPCDRTIQGDIHECLILSTCNRLELYAVTSDAVRGSASLLDFLAARYGSGPQPLQPYLTCRADRAAARHALRVACGLESLILGEPQILGQVADAYARGHAARTVGPVLSQLFAHALHAGKRARSETAISRYPTSVGHAAARRLREVFADLAATRVLVVGAGEMARLAAGALYDEGVRRFVCINRTPERAGQLAQRVAGRALPWKALPQAMSEADIVLTATAAPHPIVDRQTVAGLLPQRGGRRLVFVDIALPRDVEAGIGELPGVLLYDLDTLQGTVDAHRGRRAAAIPAVEAIIEQECDALFDWLAARDVVPVLVELRRKAESLAQAELEHTLRRLDGVDPRTEQMIALLAHRIVGKLLHEPTTRLKDEAAAGNGVAYAAALRELFALDGCPEQHKQNGQAYHA